MGGAANFGIQRLAGLSLVELWRLFPIQLRPYDPVWPQWYAEQAGELGPLLGAGARVSHIGSTAVPGLLAKPIVDILAEVAGDADPMGLVGYLEAHGWTLMRHTAGPQWRLDLNKGYTPRGFAERVFHLHVQPYARPPRDPDEICFRDWLRTHPETCRQYAALKQRLLEAYEHDRDAYTQAKTDFVRTVTAQAQGEQSPGDPDAKAGVGVGTLG